MLKDRSINESEIIESILGTDDFIDDSRMPSPEEMAQFPDTSVLDKEADRIIDCMLKERGL